jgi:hypothetical protein
VFEVREFRRGFCVVLFSGDVIIGLEVQDIQAGFAGGFLFFAFGQLDKFFHRGASIAGYQNGGLHTELIYSAIESLDKIRLTQPLVKSLPADIMFGEDFAFTFVTGRQSFD